jgi:hypothetical protein
MQTEHAQRLTDLAAEYEKDAADMAGAPEPSAKDIARDLRARALACLEGAAALREVAQYPHREVVRTLLDYRREDGIGTASALHRHLAAHQKHGGYTPRGDR